MRECQKQFKSNIVSGRKSIYNHKLKPVIVVAIVIDLFRHHTSVSRSHSEIRTDHQISKYQNILKCTKYCSILRILWVWPEAAKVNSPECHWLEWLVWSYDGEAQVVVNITMLIDDNKIVLLLNENPGDCDWKVNIWLSDYYYYLLHHKIIFNDQPFI